MWCPDSGVAGVTCLRRVPRGDMCECNHSLVQACLTLPSAESCYRIMIGCLAAACFNFDFTFTPTNYHHHPICFAQTARLI